MYIGALIALTIAIAADAVPPRISFAAAQSPVSFRAMSAVTRTGVDKAATAASHILGAANAPASSQQGVLEDLRPYGEPSLQDVVVERYEILKLTRESHEMTATVSLALDARTGNLLCAFTDPAPTWMTSNTTSDDIVSQEAAEYGFAPAHYETLKSSVSDVLLAVQRAFAVDPDKAGQIVIRPRLITGKRPMWSLPDWKPIEQPPLNAWVVEILGTPVSTDTMFPKSIVVAQFRDGDLTLLLGTYLP
jgi:hypothetical protein